MTATQATILAGAITSPLLFSLFEYLNDKLRARLRYHGWHAIFLDNSQVYFGKVNFVNKYEISIKQVYYLDSEKGIKMPIGELPLNYKLIKLGNEIHAPEDNMMINRAHVVFTEAIRDQGKVRVAIEDHAREERLRNVKF